MSYVIVAVSISLILVIHELGHLLMAKAAGIPVARFSLGLGPRLFGRTYRGTEYRLSWIPFGGYVLPDVEDEKEFFAVPEVKRILFALGGPAANILLTFVIFVVAGILDGSAWDSILPSGVSQTVGVFVSIMQTIPLLFSRPDQLSGIIGIVAQGGQFVQGNAFALLRLCAFLSMNFAVLNLLPIPALDGGQILLTALERINRTWMLRARVPLALVSWAFLLFLMVYATYLDLGRLI